MEYLWLFIAFVIMVVALWRPVKKGVIGALDARAERIRHDLDEAQRLHEEAKALLARYQQQLSDGEALAREIRTNADAERQRLETKLRQEFEDMSERRTQQALDRIAQEEAKALADLRGQAANLAILATRELITQNLDKTKANRLMAEAIGEIQRKLA